MLKKGGLGKGMAALLPVMLQQSIKLLRCSLRLKSSLKPVQKLP